MKHICLLCERTSPDSNLYCQETYCPAEMSPVILDFGEWVGDIEIVKPVMILRAAVLYEAKHQNKTVFLKVAHPGTENKERLKREAEFLRDIQLNKQQHEFLPVLLPPYANSSIRADAYGKAMLRNHLLYFHLFEFFEGEPLRDVLTKNPQLWINHIGWIMMSLAAAIAFLQNQAQCHYGLSPESVLVRFDDEPNVPRVLLYDLGIASPAQQLGHNWYPFSVAPAYTAPELINGTSAATNHATDVYGLGLTMYELLVGEPAYTYKLRSDSEVYHAIGRNRRVRMNRSEDVQSIASIALQAVNPQLAQRQPNAAVLYDQLLQHFGKVPPPKKSRWPSLNTIMLIIAALLTIAFLITLAVTLNELAA